MSLLDDIKKTAKELEQLQDKASIVGELLGIPVYLSDKQTKKNVCCVIENDTIAVNIPLGCETQLFMNHVISVMKEARLRDRDIVVLVFNRSDWIEFTKVHFG